MWWKWGCSINVECLTAISTNSSREGLLVVLETETSFTILWTIWTIRFTIDENIVEPHISFIRIILVTFIRNRDSEAFPIVDSSDVSHTNLDIRWISECTIIVTFVASEVRIFCAHSLSL